jgi:hypothetical protein
VVAVSSALAGRSDTSFTVTSSLDGKTVLPARSHSVVGPNQWFDARYLPNADVVLGAELVDRPRAVPICGSHPPESSKVVLANDGKRLQLAPTSSDSCSDRVTALEGAWTRTH